MNSTRLPGKMLLDLAGAPLVQRVIERVKRAKRIDQVVLAFPSRDINAFIPFSTLASLYGYALDEHDLVGRYLSAAQAFDADIIVRIPCDNPCVEPECIDEAITEYMSRPYNFYSNTTACAFITKNNQRLPYSMDGAGCEVFSMSTLKWLDEVTASNHSWREHPHKYWEEFVEHCDADDQEQSIEVCGNGRCVEYRLDVNTQADYEFIKDIYDALYPTNPNFSIHDILTHLERKNVPA